MPTNVPPQYRKAEERFREAVTVQEKIVALQEMLTIMPKHKGTEHLKAQHKTRLSKLMSELEDTSVGGKSGRNEPFSMPKEGGGRATLVGLTNSGKSLLMSRATGAKSQIGAYALSTQEPVRGMLPFKDVLIQLVDTPPISNPATQGRLYGLLRNTDVFVVVVDLSMDPVTQVLEVVAHLEQWGFSLLGLGEVRDEDEEWRGDRLVPLVLKELWRRWWMPICTGRDGQRGDRRCALYAAKNGRGNRNINREDNFHCKMVGGSIGIGDAGDGQSCRSLSASGGGLVRSDLFFSVKRK